MRRKKGFSHLAVSILYSVSTPVSFFAPPRPPHPTPRPPSSPCSLHPPLHIPASYTCAPEFKRGGGNVVRNDLVLPASRKDEYVAIVRKDDKKER